MQLFGLKEDIGLSLAPSQALAFGVYGLSADDGRLFEQPPVRALCQILKTQGVMSVSDGAHDPCAPSGHLPTRSVGRNDQRTNLLKSAFFASSPTFSRT